MSLVSNLIDFLKSNKQSSEGATPEGFCPNCWGRQEYGGEFYEAVNKENMDVNSASANVGWIEDYANKNLIDITLKKEDEELVCNKCKVAYRPS